MNAEYENKSVASNVCVFGRFVKIILSFANSLLISVNTVDKTNLLSIAFLIENAEIDNGKNKSNNFIVWFFVFIF